MASTFRTDDVANTYARRDTEPELTPEQKAAEFEAGKAEALERQKDPAVAEHVAKLRARDASKARGSVVAPGPIKAQGIKLSNRGKGWMI